MIAGASTGPLAALPADPLAALSADPLAALPADPLAAVPVEFWIVVGVVAAVVLLLAAGAALSPRAREKLRFLSRQTGIGWGIGLVLIVAATVSFASVFALGGTTAERIGIRRFDYPLALAFLVHAAGLFLLGDAAGSLPRYLAVRRTPRRAAPDVAAGERVAVDGEAVVVDGTLETPFAGEPALCYEARVMERRGDSSRAINAEVLGIGGNWHPEYVEREGVAFGVADDAGRVPVVPDGADLRLEETAEVTVTPEDDLPERISAFIEEHMAEVGFGAHARRYVEAALRPGDRVAVVGPAVAAPADADGPGGDAGRRAYVDAREGECVVASGSVDRFRATLRRRVARSAAGGLVLSVLGYAAMLTVSGAA